MSAMALNHADSALIEHFVLSVGTASTTGCTRFATQWISGAVTRCLRLQHTLQLNQLRPLCTCLDFKHVEVAFLCISVHCSDVL